MQVLAVCRLMVGQETYWIIPISWSVLLMEIAIDSWFAGRPSFDYLYGILTEFVYPCTKV